MSDLVHVLEGQVVLYKRSRTQRWQARLKLADGWHRVSTGFADVKKAKDAALALFYETQAKRKLNLPERTRRFGSVADAVVTAMTTAQQAGDARVVYSHYISAIQNYLKPFFGKYNIDSIDVKLLKQFEAWRAKQMGKAPVHSTITTHNSAMNKVFEYAIEHGWISKSALPQLTNKGKRSQARPAFTMEEYTTLSRKLPAWISGARTEKSRQMRELLRDYVLILANTGMRHGTEAMNLKWRDIDWIVQKQQKHLRFYVDGKTGPRYLIARHNTLDYLKRIQERFPELKQFEFDELLKKRVDEYVFRLRDGTRTNNLHQTFAKLLTDTNLLTGAGNQRRTLYSLRHAYATFALKDGLGIHDLKTQMGTSVQMIEQHYSKVTPELIADRLAGPRYAKKPRKDDAKKDETKDDTTT